MQKYTFNSDFATDFEHIAPKNNLPTVLYLHGFCSNAWGREPETIKKVCLDQGLGLVRFDFAGHGSDVDNFEKADFLIWKNQVFEIIENVISGNVIMIGSSMGGWLSMLAAIRYPNRVKGLIGLAAAPNFVKYFADQMTAEQKQELEHNGKFKIINNDFEYTITAQFIETAFASMLPENQPWNIDCPVHLLQGMRDASLPWRFALDFASQITSPNVIIKILKNSNHRLNDDVALREICSSVKNITSCIDVL